MARLSFTAIFFALALISVKARYVFFYDQYHPFPPNKTITAGIDHVIIAYANPSLFTASPAEKYIPFEDTPSVRSHFDDGTKVLIAIGDWVDNAGFEIGAAAEDSRKLFATNIASLVEEFSYDGVDIHWKFPGGNWTHRHQVPDSEKASEVENYPLLLAEIRSAIGPEKLLTISAPGKFEDMIAFTSEKASSIWKSVDWVNVMTYDFMTRRDKFTKHHSDVKKSLEVIDHYINRLQLDPRKINLGFAMFSSWFSVDPTQPCETGLGCATQVLESADGVDTGKSGSMSFEAINFAKSPANLSESVDNTCGPSLSTFCPKNLCCSAYGFCGNTADYCESCQGAAYGSGCTKPSIQELFQTAIDSGVTEELAGGQYFYDKPNSLFWTWDTPELISRKFTEIVAARNLGGVMGWSLGQDSSNFSRITALQKGVADRIEAERKEVERKEAEKKPSTSLKPIGGRLSYASTPDEQNQRVTATSKVKSWVSKWWTKFRGT